jgi:hypothetical protein
VVKISFKRELIIYADIGLVGTFVSWQERATEKGYRYLEYVPLNCFPPRKKLHPVAIHTDHIHIIHASKNEPGVIDRIIFIYTGESGSLIKNYLDNNNLKTISELREKIRKLQMQIASVKQDAEDARSGVNKTLASMKQMQRSSPIQSSYSDPFLQQPQRYGYDDFDNY